MLQNFSSTLPPPSFTVNLADTVTGEPIDGATVFSTDGEFVDRAFESVGFGAYLSFLDRSGVYMITAEADGYVTVSVGRFALGFGRCGSVNPIFTDIQMQSN